MKPKKHKKMEDYKIDDLLDIIYGEYESEVKEAAITELVARAWIAAKGGDRPDVPPRNP